MLPISSIPQEPLEITVNPVRLNKGKHDVKTWAEYATSGRKIRMVQSVNALARVARTTFRLYPLGSVIQGWNGTA